MVWLDSSSERRIIQRSHKRLFKVCYDLSTIVWRSGVAIEGADGDVTFPRHRQRHCLLKVLQQGPRFLAVGDGDTAMFSTVTSRSMSSPGIGRSSVLLRLSFRWWIVVQVLTSARHSEMCVPIKVLSEEGKERPNDLGPHVLRLVWISYLNFADAKIWKAAAHKKKSGCINPCVCTI